jgi:hypothetical protein
MMWRVRSLSSCNRIGGATIALLIASAAVSTLSAATLSGASGNAAAGQTVTLGVSYAAQASSVAALQFDLSFDPTRLSISIAAGTAAISASKSVQSMALPNGDIRVIVWGPNQTAIANGSVAALSVHVSATTCPGQYSIAVANPVAASPGGQGVSITASSGVINLSSISVPAPNVVGATQASATATLQAACLGTGTVTTSRSSTKAAGIVISESPAAGMNVSTGSTVNLVVSSGSSGAPIAVPSVTGLSQSAATAAIQNAGLAVGMVTTAANKTVGTGAIVNQSPIAGAQVDSGAKVDLLVSSGAAQGPLQFVPITPCRIADTRNAAGPLGGPKLSPNQSRDFPISESACGIPATAAAYSLNVTAVPDAQLGYLTMWPAGEPQPSTSTLNSDGRVKANAAVLSAGLSGAISIFVTNSTHIIIDINGYFVPVGASTASLQFFPLTPCRVADTRLSTGSLSGPFLKGGAAGRSFPVLTSPCGIPAAAKGYSLNFTAVPHGSLGYITVWPAGQSQPVVSTLNATTGTITANAALVPAGASGAVSVFASDDTDLIIDVNGYFAAPASGGLNLFNVTPCRVLDTRNGGGQPITGKIAVGVSNHSCMPPGAVADAFAFNVTTVPPGALVYLTLWPDAAPSQPTVSTLNAIDGAITSNMAIVPTTNGSIDAFASNPAQLILDLLGYFAP